MILTTIDGTAEAEFIEKKSRFIGIISCAEDEKAAEAFIQSIRVKHPAANHHVWAYRVGASCRELFSDDGEPALSAGKPILKVLIGKDLSNTVCVVVRYFGGTKLGVGGLIRAYSLAAESAYSEAKLVRHIPAKLFEITMEYQNFAPFERFLESKKARIDNRAFGELVSLSFAIAVIYADETAAFFTNLTRGAGRIVERGAGYVVWD